MSFIGRRRQTKHLTVLSGDQKPLARADELVVEEVGEELLVYDQTNDTAHSLSIPAARVWRACDGETTVEALRSQLDMDSDTVGRALEELDECNLLDGGQLDGMTRREATLKGAKIGAGLASAPLIYSILAPAPALAASQAYCIAQPCVQDCGDCHMIGCACCGPGNPQVGASKLCTGSCSATDCTEPLRASHCNVPQQSSGACNTSDARLKREIQPLTLDLLV